MNSFPALSSYVDVWIKTPHKDGKGLWQLLSVVGPMDSHLELPLFLWAYANRCKNPAGLNVMIFSVLSNVWKALVSCASKELQSDYLVLNPVSSLNSCLTLSMSLTSLNLSCLIYEEAIIIIAFHNVTKTKWDHYCKALRTVPTPWLGLKKY